MIEPPVGRILIVDDVPKNLQVLGTILKEEGYLTYVAQNGLEAIERAKKTSPDLILLDVTMPEIDGYEACKALKAEHKTKDIPIIFITAKSDQEDETKGLQLGAVDYITKPFKQSIVKARVKAHLKRKQAEQDRIEKEKLEGVIEMAGAVCHELNQPMQALLAYCDLLVEDVSDIGQTSEDVRKIKEQIGRMATITRKLMRVTKYETIDYVFEGKKIIDIDKASS